MRADDHQFFQPMYIANLGPLGKDQPFDEENTGWGWKIDRQDRHPGHDPPDHLQDEPAELTPGSTRSGPAAPPGSRGVLELVIISTLNGVLYGMLLFLMASGLTLIFSMMGVLNFAHASFYMLGAFFGFQISQIVGFWPAFVIAPVLVGGIGALVERYGSAQRAPARPRRRAAVHLRARLRHRGAGADGLGQGAGRFSRAGVARLPGLHDLLHQLSRLQDVRCC